MTGQPRTDDVVGLPADASAYDAGVVGEGLRADEQDRLVHQRKTLESAHTQHEPEGLVGAHGVTVSPAHWARFGLWADHPGDLLRLSRNDVTAVARRCRETNDWLPLLITSYAWGYGRRGVGPARLSRIFDGTPRVAALPKPEINHRLAGAVEALDSHGPSAAYNFLLAEWRIPALGPAFFSKFLYFADRAVSGERCRALILDSRLARSMRRIWERRAAEPYAAGGYAARWLWQGPSWTSYRYQVYLAFLHRAAAQLSQSGERWTPELVEFLFFLDNGD